MFYQVSKKEYGTTLINTLINTLNHNYSKASTILFINKFSNF